MKLVYLLPVQLTLLLLLSALGGCGRPGMTINSGKELVPVQFTPTLTNIADLQSSSLRGTGVYLRGKIGNRVPLLGGTVYELQDQTGRIWVMAQQAVPGQGDEVTIRGNLRQQSIQVDGKQESVPYIEQLEQVDHHPAIKS